MTDKMKVKIWSDTACPFCHIGKRHFENALEQFSNKDNVEIEWKSFQLDPNAQVNQNVKAVEMLAKKYGMPVEEARQMNKRMETMATHAGLNFDLENIVLTNTTDAQRLIHLAKKHNLQDQAEERLFVAYLSEGKHIGDHQVLIQLAAEIGLDKEEVKATLESDRYLKEVKEEMLEGQQLGINGVPFFVIDDKYGVSGAQPVENFVEVLNKAWDTGHKKLEMVENSSAAVCDSNGVCSV